MSIARAIMAETDAERDAYVAYEALRYGVSRQIFCRFTGEILDVRTAVMVEAPGCVTSILPGTVWDTIKDGALPKMPGAVVTDGRDYTARGVLRKGRGNRG